MGKQYEEDEEEIHVTLSLDDGTDVECVVLALFEAGEKDYVALLPLEEDEEEVAEEIYLYRFREGEDGNPILENIEDDDEYEIVSEAFDELLDDLEYDEIVEEETKK